MHLQATPGLSVSWRKLFLGLLLVWLALVVASNAVRLARQPWTKESPLPDGMQSVRVPEVGGEIRSTDTVRLAYRQWPGTDEGPVVLFVHGSPGSASDFRAIAEALPDRYRRISVDLPGFGYSSRDLPDYSSQAQARYLFRLLDAQQIERVHLVGYSLGGAVLLEMVAQRPERVLSLAMISAVGVIEHELLGDFERNRAVYGLQLALVHAMLVAVPHFGALDVALPGWSHARSLYDADLRPLRGILRRTGVPLRILHGQDDPQVPVEAALEHHRIVPHSELRLWEDEGHDLIFTRPDEVAADLADFLDRAQAGTARTLAEATPEELDRAALPYTPASRGPAFPVGPGGMGLLLAAGALVSQDAAAVTAGLLVGNGRMPSLGATASILAGLLAGDLLTILLGRTIGRQGLALLERRPLSWLVRPGDVERAATLLARHPAGVVLVSRFVPGTRFAVHVTAGVLEVPLPGFLGWLVLAALIWALLVVGGSALLGAVAASLFAGGPLAGLLVALGVLLSMRLLVPRLAHALGRWTGREPW